MDRKRLPVIYIPPLFSDDADEADTFHPIFLFVADIFVGTVVDTDTLFCLVWFDISLPLNDDGLPVEKEADLSVICLDSDFPAVVLSEGCAVVFVFPGFAAVWSASVLTPTFSPIFTGFVG